jgi:hypothetical protein
MYLSCPYCCDLINKTSLFFIQITAMKSDAAEHKKKPPKRVLESVFHAMTGQDEP